jgi:monoamine oxidase
MRCAVSVEKFLQVAKGSKTGQRSFRPKKKSQEDNAMPGASFTRLRQSAGRSIRASDKLRIMDACLSRQEAELKSIVSRTCKKQHVGIVGGGFAGLFAAMVLKSAGCRVTLWEATERVGGRVHTLRDFVKGRLIEAGAELIGLNHPLWLLLNRKFGLGLSALTSEEDYTGQGLKMPIRLGGKELSSSEVVELEAQVNVVLMQISADARLVRFPATPWMERPEIQSLDRLSLADKFDEWKVDGNVREYLTTTFECDNVSEINRQSYLGLLCVVKGGAPDGNTDLFWDTVEVFRCSKGNDSLATSIAAFLGSSVKRSTAVTRVQYRTGSNRIRIETQTTPLIGIQHESENAGDVDGGRDKKLGGDRQKNDTPKRRSRHTPNRCRRYVLVDAVVVAVPPSVWSNITFIDGRCKRLNLKPYTPALGPAAKFLSSIETRFWIKEGLSPSAIDSRLGETWEPTENQVVTDETSQKIGLSVFVGGPFVKLDRDHYTTQLSILFGHTYEKQLVKSELVVWPEQPYIRTGYSYGALGQVTTTNKRLYYPVPEFNELLHFVGEHTCVDFIGYMEGALQSGLRAARQIIGAFNTIIIPHPTPPAPPPSVSTPASASPLVPTTQRLAVALSSTSSSSSRRNVACHRDATSRPVDHAHSRNTKHNDSLTESRKRPVSDRHTSPINMIIPITVSSSSVSALSATHKPHPAKHAPSKPHRMLRKQK